MSDTTELSGDVIASQAMENLVNQFARPMDFLRELAQNSMDAGTPRVDVELEYETTDDGGVLSIHVIDYGEGMDEEIIDNQLTRLFSSNKEDDMTKIGKFGIGFTSIFAIKPDAVLLQTGRHGEYWELLFHSDRSYEKRRVDTPHSGTRITLFKRMPADEARAFSKEAHFVLTYWCEHSQIPIQFEDKMFRTEKKGGDAQSADPFAAFGLTQQKSNVQRIDGPLRLDDADLVIEKKAEDWHVVMGYAATPLYGFYNGGLTLVSSHNSEVLGGFAGTLGHLSFKLKSDALEHTLTRDNVLQDDQWERLLGVLTRLHKELRSQLLAKLADCIENGEDPTPWYRYLASELRLGGGREALFGSRKAQTQTLFSDDWSEGISLQELEDQEWALGAVLYHPGTPELAEALRESGLRLLPDTADVRAVVQALGRPPVMGLVRVPRMEINASEWFLLPDLVDLNEVAFAEKRFVEMLDEWTQFATRGAYSVQLGGFGGEEEALTEDLIILGPPDGKLFQRFRKTIWGVKLDTGTAMLLNRHHPTYRSLLAVFGEEPHSAVFTMVTTMLNLAGIDSSSVNEILLGYAHRQVLAGGAA